MEVVVPSSRERRMWAAAATSASANAAYAIPLVAKISGPLDVEALRRALLDVVRVHPAFRTSFTLQGGLLVGVVHSAAQPVLDFTDLTPLAEGASAESIAAATRMGAQPFDLAESPMLRAHVWRTGADRHLLCMATHHLVADGASVDVLDRDLGLAYDFHLNIAPGTGRWSPGDRSLRRLKLEDDDTEEALTAWRKMLNGCRDVLELGCYSARPGRMTYKGGRVIQTLDAETAQQLLGLARDARVTRFTICLALFALLLAEESQRDDLIVGIPIAARNTMEAEDLVGPFVNTVPLRIRLGDEGFSRFAASVRVSLAHAMEHGSVPFERLVREFGHSGTIDRPPLVQVVVVDQGTHRPNAALVGARVEPVRLDHGTAKFDLSLEIEDFDDTIRLTLEFSTDVMDAHRANSLLSRYAGLADAALADPERPVRQLLRMSEESSPAQTLHERFCSRAWERPDQIAVSDGDRCMTYAELDAASSAVATRLAGIGVGPETAVAVCAERDALLVVAVLGILKAGGVYVPLDPTYPAQRLRYVASDAGCVAVVGHGAGSDVASDLDLPFVDVTAASAASPCPELPRVHSSNAAYIIYTSGSTGQPKGVVVSHGNAMALMDEACIRFGLGHEDVWTLFHSYAFDFSVWEIWGALLFGGRLVVVPRDISRAPSDFLELLREESVTVLSQTPSAFHLLAEAAVSEGYPPLPLRLVIFGGEALDPSRLSGWVKAYGCSRPLLINMYGITETTVHVTYRILSGEDTLKDLSVIGRPLGHLSLLVAGPDLRPASGGERGEIYVGGAGVARGYHRRPALTAQRFVPDPASPTGSRMYRSGDLAISGSSDVVFVGRADSQVKIRGFRIELGEIEAALCEDGDVTQAVALVRRRPAGHRFIAATVTLALGSKLTPRELRARLADRLPAHAVPAVIDVVKSFPLTVNGKIDRAALGELESSALPAVNTRPSPVVATLSKQWREVLDLADVPDDESFFALGGDSILAIRAVALARDAGLAVSLGDLFESSSVREVAERATARSAEAAPRRVAWSSEYPMASMQLGILYHDELGGDPRMFHDLLSVRVAARFFEPLLRRALDVVSAKHEILRTSFDLGGENGPVQQVADAAPMDLHVEFSLEDADMAADAWWERVSSRAFDVSVPPLVRWAAHEQGMDFRLSVVAHHVILDGWSLALLVSEVVETYISYIAGAEPEPPPASSPPVYAEHVAAERATLAAPEHSLYWQAIVQDAPVTSLPRRKTGASRTANIVRSLSQDETAALRRVGRGLGVPVRSLLLAAHLTALGHMAGVPDVITGVVVNARPDVPGGDRALGLYLNILPLRARIDVQDMQVVHAVLASEVAAFPHRLYPLAAIQRDAGREVFSTVFNYTDFHVLDNVPSIDPLSWIFDDTSNFPLVVEAHRQPTSSCIQIGVRYDAATYDGTLVSNLADRIAHAARIIARKQ